MSTRLPLTDPTRLMTRDSKLWRRDKERARLYGFKRLPCPCTEHNGIGSSFSLEEIERHLIRFGRSPECRVWRGPQDPDSSDDEWEADAASKLSAAIAREERRDSGLEMRRMVQHMYQQVQAFAESEERMNNITMSALNDSDDITGINREGEIPGEGNDDQRGEQSVGDGDGDDTLPEASGLNRGGFNDDEETLGDNLRTQLDGDVRCEGVNTENLQGTHQAGGHRTFPGSDHMDIDSERLEEDRVKDAKAIEDAMRSLFDKSRHTKLGATVMLVNLVATHTGITEKAADDILATFKCLLPEDNCLPASLYQAKTLTRRLGLDFRNIEGCPNGCVLFDSEETKNLDRCPKCNAGRYKDMFHLIRPLKVLRQFRITPRLQRYYRIPVLNKLLRWHKENLSRDGKVRFPADTAAWKHLDTLPETVFDTKGFGSQERNVRMQISCDGICPFKLHKSTWSAWPVLASFLNLPPWLITKKFFIVLTLLIPGRAQVPFEHFDVWIRPLIDELKELWEGVPAYDVLAPENERVFKLRAAVLYTTHDFPGYGTVSGAAHQGYTACPPCGDQLKGKYAYESRKIIYRDARRWLREDHYIRDPRFNMLFDGLPKTRSAPVAKTPDQQLHALRLYEAWLSRRSAGLPTGSDRSESNDHNRDGIGHHSDVRANAVGESSSARGQGNSGIVNERETSSSQFQNRRKRKRTSDPSFSHSCRENKRTGKTGQGGASVRRQSQDRRRARKRGRSPDPSKVYGIKRGSSFFELPYWKVSSVNHIVQCH